MIQDPASMPTFQSGWREKSDSGGQAPHLQELNPETACVTSAPHLIGQNWVTWPHQTQRRLGNVVLILISHVFREEGGEINHAGQLAPAIQERLWWGRWAPESSALSEGHIKGFSDWMDEGDEGKGSSSDSNDLAWRSGTCTPHPLQPLIPPLFPWKMWALWWFFSSPSSLGLLTTPKCTANCCLLRKWKLILVLALAQPNLEANQLLPLNKYKGFQGQTEMTSDSQAVRTIAQPYYGDKNNHFPTEFWKYHLQMVFCFFSLDLFFSSTWDALPLKSLLKCHLISDRWWPHCVTQHPLTPLCWVATPFTTLEFVRTPITIWQMVYFLVK